VLNFGPYLDGLLFATLILLCGWIMIAYRSTAPINSCSRLIALSPCLLEVYSMIWSETLYLAHVLFIILAHGYFQTHSIAR